MASRHQPRDLSCVQRPSFLADLAGLLLMILAIIGWGAVAWCWMDLLAEAIGR